MFAYRYLADEEQCKDIAQETLLEYWQNRATFYEIYKVKSFLYTVARNKCLNLIKHGAVDELFVHRNSIDDDVYFEDELVRQETYLLVRKAIDTLPPQMHRVINMAMEGKKNAEIAQMLGITDGTVHSLKKKAYQKLRLLLKDQFYCLIF